MIAEGKYVARAKSAQWSESQMKGTVFVHVEFVTAGESVGWDGYMTGKTAERTIASLALCGCTFPGDRISDLTGYDAKEVSITVEHETWTDRDGATKKRAKVAWINDLTRQLPTMSRRAFARLDADYASLLPRRGARPASNGATSYGSDEDISSY